MLKPCSNINNAVAFSFKGVRYIMYDPEFMSELSYSNDWVNMFILAHEVGHHVNNHTIDILLEVVEDIPLFQQRMQELEADEFAGFVLGRLGAKFSQIEKCLEVCLIQMIHIQLILKDQKEFQLLKKDLANQEVK